MLALAAADLPVRLRSRERSAARVAVADGILGDREGHVGQRELGVDHDGAVQDRDRSDRITAGQQLDPTTVEVRRFGGDRSDLVGGHAIDCRGDR